MLWPHKLIVGAIQQAGWCGEVHPNNTQPWDSFKTVEQCNTSTKIGCLFNVLEDPGEHHDLALSQPGIAKDILGRMMKAQHGWYNPDRGNPDPRACEVAETTGFWAPFLDGESGLL